MATTKEDSRLNPFDIISDDDNDDEDIDGKSWTNSGYWEINGNDQSEIDFYFRWYIVEDLYGI